MMKAEWAGEVIYLMHQFDFSLVGLAKRSGFSREYTSRVLNGRENPPDTAGIILTAAHELAKRVGKPVRPEWASRVVQKIWMHGIRRKELARELGCGSCWVSNVLNVESPGYKWQERIIAAADKLCAEKGKKT